MRLVLAWHITGDLFSVHSSTFQEILSANAKGIRSSTCRLTGFFLLLNHVIYVKLRKKFFRNIHQHDFDCSSAPMLVKVTNMGAELQSQNHVDVNYRKTFGLGP